ncbi:MULTISPECIES: phosphoribosylglycinamide formyltransferase [Odoribacteraceae]|uniref:phosphoribosylglycinamide formyltransferase n=1 Tax=Odoribacteraceae TaxID=1853231 RepID=UPI000E4F4087|nr:MULTISPECIES: phosphoribosylglycinamide formyltransferase [Odoribacteraceae]MCQ4873965.1 phosphoribosylglycinamide formyltransferase [Butyricimonas paravirosa]RHR79808.1 phosphoribosylglycinamide formyltransferase [Odoribacter sp. AF15-53]
MKKIAIFASGSGSNAENIINYFQNDAENVVKIVFCNKPNAYVLERAKRLNVPTFVFGREDFYHSDMVLNELKRLDIDMIVLAGFLWKVPDAIIEAYRERVVNIHPALLPSYGGKGMYGMKVHESVIAAGEKESGITIHYVNDHYDEGATIFQARCEITPEDTPDTLAEKVHALEYEHFPRVIKEVLEKI